MINTFKTKIYFLTIPFLLSSFTFSQVLFINEIMSKNDTSIRDNDGDFSDWIELYNSSNNPINLNGYYLSDNPEIPLKWSFGQVIVDPDSFIIVYASDKNRNISLNDLHTNFKIKSSGETLILSDENGNMIDSIFTGLIPSDFSKGRQPDGSDKWVFFENITPGKQNSSDGVEVLKLIDPPLFSDKGGFYKNPVNLSLSLENSDETLIFYSLNGTEPSINYIQPINITSTTVVRTQAFDPENDKKSKIITETFFIDEDIDHTLPIISISANPNDLYGDDGILEEENFVWGPNNALIDVEIPANIEMYENGNGNLAFNHRIGLELFGSGSAYEPQKSLAIYFRSRYDVGELNYKLFPNSPISEYESFILRNSGNDMYSTHIRDALTVSLLDENTNLDYQQLRPVNIFLNGEYYGILNMREKINEHFIEHHHFVTKENLDLLSYKEVQQPVIIHGDMNQYTDLLIYLHNKDLDEKDSYPYIADIIDIENFIEYQIMQIYVGNIDWPGNNQKFWKSKYEDSKWRWIIFDTDTGYGLWDEWWQDGKIGFTVNHFNHATSVGYEGGGWPNPPFSTYIFRKLLENESFKNQFINRFLDLLNTRLSSTNVVSKIDSLLNNIESSLPRHLNRWDVWEDDLPEIHEYEIEKLKRFAVNRPTYTKTHMKNFFNLSVKETIVELGVFPELTGTIKLNSLVINESSWSGNYIQNIPLTLIAEPNAGFKFLGWESNFLQTADSKIKIFPNENKLTAIFVPDTSGFVMINEINHSSFNVADSDDWIEIFNSSSKEIDLKNWSISDNTSDLFTFPTEYSLNENDYLIITKDLNKFSKIYPNITNVIGNIPFGLNAEADSITLKDNSGNIVDIVSYKLDDPWPIKLNDSGQTLELINPILDNSDGKNWSLSKGYGTPGQRNSNYDYLYKSKYSIIDSTLNSTLINYPNPFTFDTNIEFFSEKDGLVELKIFNILGESIITLSKLNRPSGIYFDKWNGLDSSGKKVSSGVYILVMYIDSKIYASNKLLIF